MMETIGLSNRSPQAESERWVVESLFLTLLLNPDNSSHMVLGASASRSNLFFSSVYGASAEPNFGLKHPGTKLVPSA